MNIDTKKTNPTPKDKWEAIAFMNNAQQNLLEAIHIMASAVENNTDDFKDIHERRMNNFIKQFKA